MITISDLVVNYGRETVIDDLSLEVSTGEFVTLLGPSGCGKSTLLRTVGGFIGATAGRIEVEGRDVTRLDPEQRGIGFVFQSYALFPHLSVQDNVGFGLGTRKIRGAERARRVAETLEVTGLTKYAKSMPSQLSGGQQQRVAIARVLVTKPSVLLMDEPLSNLDAQLRVRLRDEIRRLHDELGITTLYVTHDQDEALSMSDRIAVMKDGAFEQIATPREVYAKPANSYVCTFVGEANALPASVASQFGFRSDGEHTLYVRPERIAVAAASEASTASPSGSTVAAWVSEVTFLGAMTRYRLDIDGFMATAIVMSDGRRLFKTDERVVCSITEDAALWLR